MSSPTGGTLNPHTDHHERKAPLKAAPPEGAALTVGNRRDVYRNL